MRTYIAISDNAKRKMGGWHQCLQWASQQISGSETVVKIFTARPEEQNARVVGEVSREGVRVCKLGRQVQTKKLLRTLPNE